MMNTTLTPPRQTASRTRIVFDLRDELNPTELEKFEAAAREAGAENLTEHFLNLALRHAVDEGRAA